MISKNEIFSLYLVNPIFLLKKLSKSRVLKFIAAHYLHNTYIKWETNSHLQESHCSQVGVQKVTTQNTFLIRIFFAGVLPVPVVALFCFCWTNSRVEVEVENQNSIQKIKTKLI